MKAYFAVFGILFGFVTLIQAFPDGAPVDVCVKDPPNRPHHGLTKPSTKPFPYSVVASSDQYSPGAQVIVTISGDFFRGFFLQARDAKTHEWIGEWIQSPNTKVIPECAGITHADPKDKELATLIWQAPADRQGAVYFTGTILKDFGNYWTEITAAVQ